MPRVIRYSYEAALRRRWWSILGVTVQRFMAESILRSRGGDLLSAEGDLADPSLVDMLDLFR